MVSESGCMESTDHTKCRIGTIIERLIEGTWFIGKVLDIDNYNMEYTVQYLDDDLVESNIPANEIRIAENEQLPSDYKTGRKSTLPKPLLGLVDDDSDIRNKHQPVVILHGDSDSDKAIIINGSEKTLAAGGGLRALRYLKK
mmetsp:Transcript_22470/g.32799  ORF Transcript_22470/g.32799 Transcript_22470/m.32799 type:complete len:142 (+) Transcript_22470:138-563(+)